MSGDEEAEGQHDEVRKERVLHTRVPAVLEQELKRLALSLKVPVSNVVRTILEDAVDTLDSVGRAAEGELRDAAERLRQHRGALLRGRAARSAEPDHDRALRGGVSGRAPLAGIIGYQPLLLAGAERCSLCGRSLAAGSQAYLGIREPAGGARVILGQECLPWSAGAGAPAATDPTDGERRPSRDGHEREKQDERHDED
jgi:hypothetical protein